MVLPAHFDLFNRFITPDAFCLWSEDRVAVCLRYNSWKRLLAILEVPRSDRTAMLLTNRRSPRMPAKLRDFPNRRLRD